jgi:hypothetical protein
MRNFDENTKLFPFDDDLSKVEALFPKEEAKLCSKKRPFSKLTTFNEKPDTPRFKLLKLEKIGDKYQANI